MLNARNSRRSLEPVSSTFFVVHVSLVVTSPPNKAAGLLWYKRIGGFVRRERWPESKPYFEFLELLALVLHSVGLERFSIWKKGK